MRWFLLVFVACKSNPTEVEPPDCDGTPGFADRDGDGFGDPNRATNDCVEFVVDNGDDCDDQNFNARPDGEEVCDDVDNDCDGLVDIDDPSLDVDPQYADADNDGYGTEEPVLACGTLLDHADVPGDCDDGDPEVNPDALEVCDEGVDNDCNGLADDGDPNLDSIDIYYEDLDLDGYGAGTPIPACEAPFGAVMDDSDCDDNDNRAFPGAVEICDNLDQNCDGDPDSAPLSADPCLPDEGSYEGALSFTLENGGVLVTCTGTATLTVDREAMPPVSGTFSCDLDAPQNQWSPTQTGAISGLYREDSTLAGTIEAMEGNPTDWTGTMLDGDLSATGGGLFVDGGGWDLDLTMTLERPGLPGDP